MQKTTNPVIAAVADASGEMLALEPQSPSSSSSSEAERAEPITSTAPGAARSPATVAQPVAYLMTRPSGFSWPLMPKDMTPEWREVCEADATTITPLYAAQPCPSQGCGGDGGEAFNDAQIEVLQFLTGVGKLRGCGFGEKPAEERGNFWWRSALRAAFPGIPVLSTDKGDGGARNDEASRLLPSRQRALPVDVRDAVQHAQATISRPAERMRTRCPDRLLHEQGKKL